MFVALARAVIAFLSKTIDSLSPTLISKDALELSAAALFIIEVISALFAFPDSSTGTSFVYSLAPDSSVFGAASVIVTSKVLEACK